MSIVVPEDTFGALTLARTRGSSAIAQGPNTLTFGTEGTLVSTPFPSGPDVLVTTEETPLSDNESQITITFRTANGAPFVNRGQRIDGQILDTIVSRIGFQAGDGIDFVTPVEYTSARSNYFVDGVRRASFNTVSLIRGQASPEELVLSLGVGFVSPPADIGAFGLDQIRHTITVSKLNIAPEIESLSVTPEIDENGTVTLTGLFTDPDLEDQHTVEIDWNDPNNPELTTLNLNGDRNFTATYTYLDDGVAPGNDTPSDRSEIAVTVTDAAGEASSSTVFVDVFNVAPVITDLTAESTVIDDEDGGGAGDSDEDEGVLLTVTGAFSDPGSLDDHTGDILWSDGVTGELAVTFDGSIGTFTTERFISEEVLETFPEAEGNENNFPEFDDDVYLIGLTATIADDDTGIAQESLDIFVSEETGIV